MRAASASTPWPEELCVQMAALAVFRSRRMAVLFVLGFSSGIPLYLTGNTLQAWLTTAGVSNGRIATLSLIGLAYTLKVAWAPMGSVDPVTDPELLAVLAVVVAFLSASQDIVLDAYNADVLAPEERAAGSAVYVLGYRTAMVVTGTVALLLADHLSWSAIYGLMAALMLIGVAGTLAAEEPAAPVGAPRTIVEAIYLPFVELWRRLGPRRLALVLAFTALYKAGDYFAQALVITFLVRGAHFELSSP